MTCSRGFSCAVRHPRAAEQISALPNAILHLRGLRWSCYRMRPLDPSGHRRCCRESACVRESAACGIHGCAALCIARRLDSIIQVNLQLEHAAKPLGEGSVGPAAEPRDDSPRARCSYPFAAPKTERMLGLFVSTRSKDPRRKEGSGGRCGTVNFIRHPANGLSGGRRWRVSKGLASGRDPLKMPTTVISY